MKKLFFTSILLLTLAFSATPTLADFTPLGAQCTPDSTTVNQTCPFCPGQTGAPVVHLKWKLTGNFSQPNCYLYCSRKDVYEHCAHSRYTGEDGNSVATSTNPNPAKFRPVDDTLVLKPEDTDIYRVSCVETDPTKPTPRLVQSSPEMRITSNCAEGCEVPFETITTKLENSKTPTLITEANFRGWGEGDMQDATALSQDRGSGARGDLIDYIKKKQEVCQYCDGTVYSKYSEVIPVLKETLGNKKPIVLALKFKDVPYGSPGHAVIGLDLTNESSWSTTTSGVTLSGKKYDIKMLDPNGPAVKTFNCKTYDPNPLIPDLNDDLNCSPAYPTRVGNKFFYIRVLKSKLDQTNSLWGLRGGYCEITPPGSDFCQRDLSSYIGSNYPEIDNGLEEFENGCCAGWSDVVLKVGYLGQFTSKDFHPNDGNTVGNGCDANHYPTAKSAQAGSTFWLANLWSVLTSSRLLDF